MSWEEPEEQYQNPERSKLRLLLDHIDLHTEPDAVIIGINKSFLPPNWGLCLPQPIVMSDRS